MFQAFLLQEMNQWVRDMEGSAFFLKVLTLVVTCKLRFVKKGAFWANLSTIYRN